MAQLCMKFLRVHFLTSYKIFINRSTHMSGSEIGAAFLNPQTNPQCKLKTNSNMSITFSELITISEALLYIEIIEYSRFVVLTDSKNSLQQLAPYTSNFPETVKAYTILDSTSKLSRIQSIKSLLCSGSLVLLG